MPENRPPTVCIIPAFNEARTVGTIAAVAAGHPDVDSVVVIDDGSEDDTSVATEKIDGVRVVRLEPNQGKGAAMHAGLNATTEPVILFLDADLIGLNPEHITDLLAPLFGDEADMSVGLFRGGRLHTDLAHIIAPSLSGQRGVRRSVFDNLDMDSVGFGIERALTELWENGTIRVKEVIMHGVSHVTKEEKRGYMEGVKQRIGMYADILRFEGGRLKRRINHNLNHNDNDKD